MPEGHLPVRSYLSVPVVSRNGDILGGLFLGHPEPGVFTSRHEGLLNGVAAQAAVSLDNARLLNEAKAAEGELRNFNRNLEQQVVERTKSLQEANASLLAEIAHRHQVEEQLRQSQKMEAVGQLTGGIAHDFNNLLSVVLGSLQLIRRRLDRGEAAAAYKFLDNASEGATRAAALTQRLLAFSRRQALAPEPIDANKLVSTTSELLRRTLGEHVEVETVLAGGLWATHADRPQLESAIINLAVNARDAMPTGGKLTIETANSHLDDAYTSQHTGVAAGQYVMIAVTDTGTGMPRDVLDRAFDPFFTTKAVGQGTGLGLSQVYGFVRQSKGHVKLYSEPGEGTTVKVYLPRFHGDVIALQAKETIDRRYAGDPGKTILVVEDDEGVRRTTVASIQEIGYSVIEAASAADALRVLDKGVEVTLLFTDVVMPEINGRKLADEAKRRRPELKVLFTTGYTQNAIVHNGLLDPGVDLIGKPFSLEQLSAKIRAVLEP
jgi:signal transduction histidine kinase